MTTKSMPLRPSPDVVARRLDKAGVLVHLGTNQVFELNETGIRIWELIAEGHDTQRIIACLMDEFDVDEPRAKLDVDGFLDRFRREGLLV